MIPTLGWNPTASWGDGHQALRMHVGIMAESTWGSETKTGKI